MKKLITLFTFMHLFMTLSAQGNCLNFTASLDRATLPSEISGDSDFTLEVWFRSDNTTLNGHMPRVFTWWGDPNSRLEGGDIDGEFVIYTKSVTGVNEFFNTNIFIRDGQWHHVAVSRQGNNYDVYIDGNLTNTFEKSIDLYNNFSIGNWNGTSIQNSQWIGDLDEIRLWDVVRSQSDIQATMNCELTGNETCLAGYWNFNQGTPAGDNTGLTTLIDLTPNGNDGTLFDFTLVDNTSNWVTSGADISGACPAFSCQNNCLNFTASLDRATLPSEISGDNDFTLEVWFRSDNTTLNGHMPRVFTWWGDPNSRLEGGDIDGEFVIYTKSVTGVDEFFNTNIFIRDGQWHHVAVSRKGNNYDVYIDGNLTNTFEKSIDLYNNFSIGNWNGTSIQNSQWIGDLDEIRLWDVVRSQSDIQATMNCELTGNETCLAGYWNFNQGTPAGDNTGLTTLIDLTPNGNDGTLFDFTLADNTSNWVTSGADISGGCSNVMCSVLSVENIDFKDKIENFKVYPNPSHGSVNLEIVNPMQESVLVQIYDSDGRQVYYNIIKDHQILTIEEQVFERNGIYLITVNRGSKVNHKKLVISGLR